MDATRSRLMPINRRFPLEDLLAAVSEYYEETGQRVTYEVIFFDGVNDTEREVGALIRLARRVPCKINVIPYHSIAFTDPTGIGAGLRPSPRLEELVRRLRDHHLHKRRRHRFVGHRARRHHAPLQLSAVRLSRSPGERRAVRGLASQSA